jgi:hypothetical protein
MLHEHQRQIRIRRYPAQDGAEGFQPARRGTDADVTGTELSEGGGTTGLAPRNTDFGEDLTARGAPPPAPVGRAFVGPFFVIRISPQHRNLPPFRL